MDNLQYNQLLDMPFDELLQRANALKKSHRGDSLSLCSIMNVKSGACSEDCAFCAQSARYKSNAPVYPMKSADDMVRCAENAKKAGATRFSLVASGRGPSERDLDKIAAAIEKIKKEVGIDVCASLGLVSMKQLKALKEAGLTRYHHNLEACKSYFPQIVSTHSYEERANTIKHAKEAGLEVCAGGIFGLGESEVQRLELAFELSGLGVDSVPLNFLIPIEGTPLYNQTSRITPLEAIRVIAAFRLILPNVPIRLAAGRETLLKDFLALAFYAGADGMMIGGYLTRKGRAVKEDQDFCKEIKKMWS